MKALLLKAKGKKIRHQFSVKPSDKMFFGPCQTLRDSIAQVFAFTIDDIRCSWNGWIVL